MKTGDTVFYCGEYQPFKIERGVVLAIDKGYCELQPRQTDGKVTGGPHRSRRCEEVWLTPQAVFTTLIQSHVRALDRQKEFCEETLRNIATASAQLAEHAS